MCLCSLLSTISPIAIYMPLAIEAVGSESSGLYISGGVC